MPENNIEILSPYPKGVVHRMKFNPLIERKPKGLSFCRLGEGNEQTVALLINGLYVDIDKEAGLATLLQQRAKYAVIMLYIPDLDNKFFPSLKKWEKFVDVFLLPTPEMKKIFQLFTERRIEVLLDPLDFGFADSFTKTTENKAVLKVAWFGYPDSYQKSMVMHERALIALHQKKEIEYHLVTRHNNQGDEARCILHKYVPETFPALLQSFDVCVLSHIPADFDINTYCKSENKAVLAINRGVPVIASRTPAYERLLTACGLEEYLFASDEQLLACINKLRSVNERKRYLARSQEFVLKNYSATKMIQDWLEIYENVRLEKFKKPLVN